MNRLHYTIALAVAFACAGLGAWAQPTEQESGGGANVPDANPSANPQTADDDGGMRIDVEAVQRFLAQQQDQRSQDGGQPATPQRAQINWNAWEQGMEAGQQGRNPRAGDAQRGGRDHQAQGGREHQAQLEQRIQRVVDERLNHFLEHRLDGILQQKIDQHVQQSVARHLNQRAIGSPEGHTQPAHNEQNQRRQHQKPPNQHDQGGDPSVDEQSLADRIQQAVERHKQRQQEQSQRRQDARDHAGEDAAEHQREAEDTAFSQDVQRLIEDFQKGRDMREARRNERRQAQQDAGQAPGSNQPQGQGQSQPQPQQQSNAEPQSELIQRMQQIVKEHGNTPSSENPHVATNNPNPQENQHRNDQDGGTQGGGDAAGSPSAAETNPQAQAQPQ